MPRLRLRWKIMVLTVLPLAIMIAAAVAILNRSITRQVEATVWQDLARAGAVLETILASRARELQTSGQVLADDPKFFAALTIPAPASDPQLQATVAGVARDFNRITQVDLFEVVSSDGILLASVAQGASLPASRAPYVEAALAGRPMIGILAGTNTHFELAATPIIVGGRVAGVLLLGSLIGRDLASRLRELTRSEVTFLSSGSITGTTLDPSHARQTLLSRLDEMAHGGPGPRVDPGDDIVELRTRNHVYLTLIRPLPGTAAADGQTYVVQRLLDEETAFLRTMQRDLLSIGLAALVAAVLAGWVIARRITTPVQRLVRGAEEMERGNFDYPLGAEARDEIGTLARSFSEMRQRHRAYVDSLKQVARLKSEFLTVASHELRTPISIVAGYQELMAAGKLGPISDAQREGLEAIARSVHTLTRITEDATHMAQIEGDRLELTTAPASVAAIVRESVETALADAAGRKVHVDMKVEGEGIRATVDAERLAQALANLVRNGIRFTPDGGRVTVSARAETEGVVFSVRDTGVGIAPDMRASLFDRALAQRDSLNHHSSSRLEFRSAGMGLGLSIARGIVLAHRGTLDFESTPGQGTTFTIRIPACAHEHAADHHRLERAA